MRNYHIITTEETKAQFSRVISPYIGREGLISYKKAAKELRMEMRTLCSWARGERQITLTSLLKLSLYLPTSFIERVIKIGRENDYLQQNHK